MSRGGGQMIPNRCAIYVVFDKDGFLSNFRKYYIEKLLPFVGKLLVVVRGSISDNDLEYLKSIDVEYIICKNIGLLTYGWLDGIAHLSWEKIAHYDELLLLNDSFFGPLYDLKDFFDFVDNSDADFIGAIRNFEDKSIKSMGPLTFKHGHIRGSICYFYVIKSRLLHSSFFIKYWSQKPDIASYFDQIKFNETNFYDEVLDHGFKIDSYQSENLKGYVFDSLSLCTEKLIREERVPFIRARSLGTDIKHYSLQYSDGSDARKALDFISKKTSYDIDLIWDYLLRTKNLTDLYRQLELHYILSEIDPPDNFLISKTIAVFIHLYYEDQLDKIATYCLNFPENTDFYISTTDLDKADRIKKRFLSLKLNVQVRVRPNVGGEAPTLWVTFSDVILSDKYEFACYFHAKKSSYFNYSIIGDAFANRCYENLFVSRAYVLNVLKLFHDENKLGILVPPNVYHGPYFSVAYRSWGVHYEKTKKLAKDLRLSVDISPDKVPVAPYGCMFWFRTAALKKGISHGFTYDNFNVEYQPDGTFMHAIERIYPFVAQDSGFYTATIGSLSQNRTDIINYQIMLDDILVLLDRKGVCPCSYNDVLTQIQSLPVGNVLRNKLSFIIRLKRFVRETFPPGVVVILRKINAKFFKL